MPEIIRSRDCVIFLKGDTQTVVVSQEMVDSGWPGAQGVQWAGSVADERVVTYSTGLFGGILLYGSDEPGEDFASSTRAQTHWRFATLLTDSNVISTSTYERYTYASRVSGPLVPLVYTAQDTLYLSRRGLFTKEDEMTLTSDPLAPALNVGVVTQTPKASNNHFLGVQTFL
jgi:hypothetical protein